MPYQPGDILLDKYQVIRLLGRGAFAEVYLARHRTLEVERALKILRRDAPGLGSSEFRDYQERFLLEGKLGAQLNAPRPHPNLLQVFDQPPEKDSLLILEMEYAEGGSLAGAIQEAVRRDQPLLVEQVIQAGIDIARALALLHQRGIIHRDVKPSNILLTGDGSAKLADLGLAQSPESKILRDLQGSQAFTHPGTYEYMPPEQRPPGSAPLRPNADIYALGCSLFEALSGQIFFHQEAGVRIAGLRPETPGWLDELFAAMLEPDPGLRQPWNGQKLLEALQAGQAQQAALLAETRRQEEIISRQLATQSERLSALVETAIAAQDWGGADKHLQEMYTLGPPGRKAAKPLEQRLVEARARQAAEAHDRQLIKARRTSEQRQRMEEWTRRLRRWLLWLALLTLAVVGGIWIGRYLNTQTAEKAAQTLQEPVIPSPTLSLTPSPTPYPTPIMDDFDVPMGMVPGGEFQMGSVNGGFDELPAHAVTLDDFYIDIFEVTNARYAECVQAGRCTTPGKISSYSRSYYYGNPEFADFPVIYIAWEQAKTYCEWRGGRLPTEAEWEKAARGGLQGKDYPWGDEAPVCQAGATNGANFDDCSGRDTQEVGRYSANGYGLYDMAGNVWEWAADWYGEAYYASSPAENPQGSASRDSKVLRGGAWNYIGYTLRTSDRHRYVPGNQYYLVGFRCARSP